ncbi:MAG: ribosome-binding factor A [Candidatus Omnitrophica bacterium CG08_land_8_20_14_0_20_41_16]|uniref:Ribosome-binding factor A n=1 Tax=Candidatus Sherwoodlollariibacterium unditelluris TaxID=1974757 RepID=A0A2G9YHU6_9BACT|nr:MAG: ribosome-binding factor A [Candidatus Omnitrophica bacterium CG23_combo_of_CG06-09_8_20_14_all_41_10]PIS34313.1 MAG: ribosome-binding factor A [Candidatus Omnitrophica bacterium CG08_land_8_20_14_0_20_41_16]
MSRQDKVGEAIRQEASIIIHDKLKDPRLGFITITRVEMTHDLRFAKIFFSVLGNEEAYKKTKEALNSSMGFVRRLVARRLNLRFAPEIAFYEDRSTEYSVHIEEILNKIKESDKSCPSPNEAAGGDGNEKEGAG